MLTGLLGHRISYSASPAMQEAAFRVSGLDWSYSLLDVSPEELAGAVESLRGEEWAGANVTIPHKLSVMPMLDDVDEIAESVGAVNFIRREGRRLLGSNTDVEGVRAALKEVGIVSTRGLKVVVLGAGGSARACRQALDGADISFVTRRATEKPIAGGRVLTWWATEWRALARGADLLVNTTPIGRNGDLPCAIEDIPAQGAVIDLVYASPTTPLVAAARGAGRPAADGWTVLLGQGAAAFKAWTGLEAPREAMRRALSS